MSEKLLLELYERISVLEDKVAYLEQSTSNIQITEIDANEQTVEVKGKYRYLSDYLATSGEENITLTFDEIEKIIHCKLPPSARQHRANWSNTQTLALSKAWFNVGYRTVDVDMKGGVVKFERAKYVREGGAMSKYEPLGIYLESTGEDYVRLSFAEIEAILEFPLIDSLKRYEVAWYGTSEKSPTHTWKKVWCNYGYQVDTVNLDAKTVRFKKTQDNRIQAEKPKVTNDDTIKQFTSDMYDIYRKIATLGRYKPTMFLRMLDDKGAMQTATYLINSIDESYGYTKLFEIGRLDLTVEALVVSKWQSLFSALEVQKCKERLAAYGYTAKEEV